MIRPCAHAVIGLLCCFAIPGFGQSSDAQTQAKVHLHKAHYLLSENKPNAAIPEIEQYRK
jgi:hypothetical protein